MKKIFYVIFIIFFSVSCGKDDKDLPLNSLPEDSVTGDVWIIYLNKWIYDRKCYSRFL